jgi:hypothetical protein
VQLRKMDIELACTYVARRLGALGAQAKAFLFALPVPVAAVAGKVQQLANRLFELTQVNAFTLEQQMMLRAMAQRVRDESARLGIRNVKGADGAAVLLTLPASPRVRTE